MNIFGNGGAAAQVKSVSGAALANPIVKFGLLSIALAGGAYYIHKNGIRIPFFGKK